MVSSMLQYKVDWRMSENDWKEVADGKFDLGAFVSFDKIGEYVLARRLHMAVHPHFPHLPQLHWWSWYAASFHQEVA